MIPAKPAAPGALPRPRPPELPRPRPPSCPSPAPDQTFQRGCPSGETKVKLNRSHFAAQLTLPAQERFLSGLPDAPRACEASSRSLTPAHPRPPGGRVALPGHASGGAMDLRQVRAAHRAGARVSVGDLCALSVCVSVWCGAAGGRGLVGERHVGREQGRSPGPGKAASAFCLHLGCSPAPLLEPHLDRRLCFRILSASSAPPGGVWEMKNRP